MERFHTHLQEGLSKARALRAAQMEMIAEGTYAHPYYWAAFGITGDLGEGYHHVQEQRDDQATLDENGRCCGELCPVTFLPLALVALTRMKERA
jgi:hypothetical protein